MLWSLNSPEEQEALEEIYAAGDRAAAIVGAAFLDTSVDKALHEKLIGDDKGGKLPKKIRRGSFATKIQLGSGHGVYGPETREDLHVIAKIRNKFAHEFTIRSFEAQSVRDLSGRLKLVDHFIHDREKPDDHIKWVKGLTVKIEERDARMAKPRERYLATVSLNFTALNPRIVQARDHSQGYNDSATGLP